jgi:hypothetical protein
MMLHVRFDGRSFALLAHSVGVTAETPDAKVLRAVARHLDLRLDALNGLVVDRRPSGDIVVRPEAVYG